MLFSDGACLIFKKPTKRPSMLSDFPKPLVRKTDSKKNNRDKASKQREKAIEFIVKYLFSITYK